MSVAAQNAIQSTLFQLKFTKRTLERESKKAEKAEAKEKQLLEKAMKSGNHAVARIHAQNAVRKQSESMNYMQLASRVDAVAGRVQTAATMQQVTGNMAKVSKAMEVAMKTMSPERITAVMDNFEKNFNDLDVVDEYSREATSSANAVTMPQEEVDRLMAQAADNVGVELNKDLNEATPSKSKIAEDPAEEGLSERLRALRN